VRTSWWRPHLELVAGDLNVFFGVPGAEGLIARFLIARADRPRALVLANEINDGIRRTQSALRLEDADDPPISPPPRSL